MKTALEVSINNNIYLSYKPQYWHLRKEIYGLLSIMFGNIFFPE